MSLEPKKITELTEEQRLASLVALRRYKSYVAILLQSGTNAPTVVVLENTIGDIVWTRDIAGRYYGTLANAFTENKTFIFFNKNNDLSSTDFVATRSTVNNVILINGMIRYDSQNEELVFNMGDTFTVDIEIRVYE